MKARNWLSTTLGEQLTFQRGFDITKKEQEDGEYPVISSSGTNSTHSTYMVEGPGVVIGRKGTLGTVFYVQSNFWPHDTTLWVKDFHGNHSKYAYFFLKTMGFEQYDCGASNPTLNRNHIHTLPISYPPLPIQRKIAGVLSAYDDLIENNTRRIAILEEMAQAIYRKWFVHFRFPGHEKVKLINSPLGKIPEGWKVVKVEELANHSTEGISPGQYQEEVFAHFSIPNYDKGQLPQLELGASIQSNKFIVPSGCVMLSKLNPRIPRIWLPEPQGDYRPVASTEFLIVSPLAPATREFIYCQFQSDDFSGRFRSRSSGTSTSHQRVKPTDFVKLAALLPPSSLIEEFTSHVFPICRLTHNRRIHSRDLRTTRDLLLPKLISGQLDVEELDIDAGEPLMEAEA